jgi:hypothetical protein
MMTPFGKLAWLLTGLLLAACSSSGTPRPRADAGDSATTAATNEGVGDRCLPSSVPEGGFSRTSSTVETNVSECATETCIVHELGGDPVRTVEEGCQGPTCLTAAQVEERVHCSCRCRTVPGDDSPTCACPDTFVCKDVVPVGGGDALRGAYCVRESTAAETP